MNLANVYLLPTDKKELNLTPLVMQNGDLYPCYNPNYSYENAIFQHLYITLPQSDLEISNVKEGDFVIDIRPTQFGKIEKVFKTRTEENVIITDNGKVLFINQIEKIIAATDTSLIIEDLDTPYDSRSKTGTEPYNLPSIPQSFIKSYISEFNKWNIIHKKQLDTKGK
jgi:hypothetical protein